MHHLSASDRIDTEHLQAYGCDIDCDTSEQEFADASAVSLLLLLLFGVLVLVVAHTKLTDSKRP